MTAIKNPDGSERLISLEDVEEISEFIAQRMRLCRHGGHRGRTALAAVTRVSETQIKRYEDKDDPLIMPIDIAIEMEVLLGYPSIAALMADIHGYDLVKRTPGRGKSLKSLCIKSIKEAAEAQQAMLEAEEDGFQTLDAWRSILKEASEARDVFADIVGDAHSNIRRIQGGE
ncbi:hypothetical protein [uncultured Cohaesibacter sp.]|uniref:hypothetical protein n=1 Tax=uncultured Cohaesibacter sp. TaxID=1002546 RepID=UPI0029C697A3|nr:hypothetical protein [uncultured Cohaesibacter sp.]